MKRLWLFVAALVLLPTLALAQTQPAVVTLVQPGQPQNGQALPGSTVAAVAITVQSSALVNVTGIKVQKVGSANNAAIARLQVNTDQTTVVGTASGFDANNSVTIPITATTSGAKTFLVSAVMAGNLTPYAGQSFELNITAVTTSAVSQSGVLPVYGAQFLIGTGAAKPTCSISASTGTYQIGQTVNISWRSSNATGGTITGIGTVGPSGRQGILAGGQSQTFTGTFTGPGGTGTCQLTLTLTSATGGTVSSSGGDFGTGSVGAPGSGDTVTPGTVSGGTGSVSLPSSGAKPASNIIPCSGLDCRPCDVAALAQNTINYLIGLTIPLAAVMFAWAGILYFTSATNSRNIEKAKSVFGVVLWGFLIAIGAYLAIQLFLRTVLGSQYQNWNSIQCVDNTNRPGLVLRDASGNIILNTSSKAGNLFGNIGGLNTNDPQAVGLSTGGISASGSSFNERFSGTPKCASGYYLIEGECYDEDGNRGSDPTYSTVGGATGNSGAGTEQWASSLAGYCQAAELDTDECRLARAIMANESSGRPGVISSANCVGLMQVCPATACNLDPSVNGCSSGNYGLVTQALLDPQTNMRLGTQLIGDLSDACNGDEACIAAGYNGGIGATKPSKTCIGTTIWECTANKGYAETRVYVPRVLNTYSKF